MNARSIILAALALASCCREKAVEEPPASPFKDVLTLTRLGPDASWSTSSNILERGDFGIGVTTQGLVILAGTTFHHLDSAGAADSNVTGGVDVLTFFETDRAFDVGEMNYAIFKNTLDWKRTAPARVQAVRVTGAFSRLVLDNAGDRGATRGTIRGFFFPDYLRGLREPGYDLYFLDDKETFGGRVADFTIQQARIELDECPSLALDLPEKM